MGKQGVSRKVRVVFDAMAKYRGGCLNDAICNRPTLLNPLPVVVIRFREGEIVWAADTKAMFSRIRLSKRDSKYHGFLYPEKDGTTSICRCHFQGELLTGCGDTDYLEGRRRGEAGV